MIREVPFWEFQERVESGGFRANAISGMWNWLAERLISFRRTSEAPADCVIPLEKILNFTPWAAKETEGIGPARLAVYEAVYQSFLDNPEPFPDHFHEVTRESLDEFAKSKYTAVAIGGAWYEFLRGATDSREAPTLETLERFCERMEDRQNWSLGFKPIYHKILIEWLERLRLLRES